MSFSEVMLIITFILLLVVLYKVFKQDSLQPKDVEHAISRAWSQSGIKLAIIKTGSLAYRLSEKAEQIRSDVRTLAEQFEALRSSWETLSTHVRNMSNKMQEVDRVYKRLSNDFERIKQDVG